MAGSSLGRLRSLAHRVRTRLDPRGEFAGTGFGPHRDLAFAVLEEEGEGAFQRAGASLVGAWEVGITDLARVLEPRLQSAAKNKLTERLSDALVPTQQALQDGKRAFSTAVKSGTQRGLQTGQLADATAPVVAALRALGPQVAQGWSKTGGYLDLLWQALPQGSRVQVDYAAIGPRLESLFQDEAERFAQAMQALPEQRSLEAGLREAMETWYGKVSVGIEILVYDGRTVLVQAAELLPLR